MIGLGFLLKLPWLIKILSGGIFTNFDQVLKNFCLLKNLVIFDIENLALALRFS